eukprot:4103177-Prymnesium_polylepis.2
MSLRQRPVRAVRDARSAVPARRSSTREAMSCGTIFACAAWLSWQIFAIASWIAAELGAVRSASTRLLVTAVESGFSRR